MNKYSLFHVCTCQFLPCTSQVCCHGIACTYSFNFHQNFSAAAFFSCFSLIIYASRSFCCQHFNQYISICQRHFKRKKINVKHPSYHCTFAQGGYGIIQNLHTFPIPQISFLPQTYFAVSYSKTALIFQYLFKKQNLVLFNIFIGQKLCIKALMNTQEKNVFIIFLQRPFLRQPQPFSPVFLS